MNKRGRHNGQRSRRRQPNDDGRLIFSDSPAALLAAVLAKTRRIRTLARTRIARCLRCQRLRARHCRGGCSLLLSSLFARTRPSAAAVRRNARNAGAQQLRFGFLATRLVSQLHG